MDILERGDAKSTKISKEQLGSGDILILSVVLPNLPDRKKLLKLARGENIVIFPRQVGDEKWEVELKKDSAGRQNVLFILMHTKDDSGQETTYGIITDRNIQEIRGRIIGARNRPIMNYYREPMNFDQTTEKFKKMASGKIKLTPTQKAEFPSSNSQPLRARKSV